MAIIPFFKCSKTLGESGKQEIYNKCSENSRYQIVFRTDIFQKLSLGAPEPGTCFFNNYQKLTIYHLGLSSLAPLGKEKYK